MPRIAVSIKAESRYCASGMTVQNRPEYSGGEENRAEYIPYNQLDDIHNVIVAYDDDIPVGSASFKKYDGECAEVKRVFIKEEYRCKGIANKLMGLLENAAREQGYRYLILESSEPLVAAMALYRKNWI